MKRAAVIGSGAGGLSAAIRLAVKGYEVHVYEAAEKPGGKLTELHKDGFRFDMGPSLFTLPELVDELYAICGHTTSLPYQKLEIITRYFFPDNTDITAWQDVERFAREVEEKTMDSAASLHKFLRYSQRIYDLTHETFLFRSLHRVDTWLTKAVGKAVLQLHRLDLLRTMHQAIRSSFRDPRLVQLFDRYATYNGSNPYEAPATLNVIPHLEHNIGAFFPTQGMYAITKGLHQLAIEQGVRFHFSTPVERIVHAGKRLSGLQIAGATVPFDVVVSDVDVHKVYERLLPDVKAPSLYLNQPKSTSALIFYWGINTSFPDLDLHNIFFTADYHKEFQQLFHEQHLNADPTVYVFISSKQVPGDAPPGQENWFVMINAPHNNGQDWEQLIPQQRDIILDKLEQRLGRDIRTHILFEEVLDPRTIESRTSSHLGALYGNSSNNTLAAFLRHPNKSRKVRGLYFVGGSVHPGGGIPLCLASARIVDGMIPKP